MLIIIIKNGRCARPTSDRSLAGAIAEAQSFFYCGWANLGGWMWVLGNGRHKGCIEDGFWEGALKGIQICVRSWGGRLNTSSGFMVFKNGVWATIPFSEGSTDWLWDLFVEGSFEVWRQILPRSKQSIQGCFHNAISTLAGWKAGIGSKILFWKQSNGSMTCKLWANSTCKLGRKST